MKKMNKILSSLLVCQLSFSIIGGAVFAEEVVDEPEEPKQEEPKPEEPKPEEPKPEEPSVTNSVDQGNQNTSDESVNKPEEPSENSVSEEPKNGEATETENKQVTESPVTETEKNWTPPQPTYPEYVQPNINEFDIVEEAPIIITDKEETSVQEDIVETLDLRAIIVPSLTNPAIKLAYKDYLYVINTYNFGQEEPGLATLREVQDDFQAYLLTGRGIEDYYYDSEALSEIATELGKVDPQPEIIELDNLTLVNYHYYYANDFGQNGKKIASLQFAYLEDRLSSVNLVNHVPIIVQGLNTEELDFLSSGQASLADLDQMRIPIIGLGHQMVDGQVLETLVSISGEVDADEYEFIKVSPEAVYLDSSQLIEEEQDLSDTLTFKLNQIEGQMGFEEENQTSEIMTETSIDEAEESLEESQIDTTVEETEAIEESMEVIESSDNDNQLETVIEKLPLDFSYDPDKVIGMGQLKEGYQKLIDALKDQPNLTVEELQTWFGRPTDEQVAGSSLSQKYIAIADDKVLYINVLSNNETGEIKQVKVDNRTNRLFEVFPLVIDDLFTIAENNAEIINQLNSKLGEPTVVEYLPESNQVRFVWTSFEDKAMKNIEAIQDLATKEIELLYYEP